MVTSFFPLCALLFCGLTLLSGCEPPLRAQCLNDSLAKPDRWLVCRALCDEKNDPESCAAMTRLEGLTLKSLNKTVPNTREGLRTTLERITTLSNDGKISEASILAHHLSLPDPNAWFAAHFPPDVAARLTQGYAQDPLKLYALPQALKDEALQKRTGLLIHEVHALKDDRATLLQLFALEQASAPVKLYTARWVRDMKTSGFVLWSFAHHDGHFYYLGKLWRLEDPPPTDPAIRAMRELPLEQVRALLANNPNLVERKILKHIKTP